MNPPRETFILESALPNGSRSQLVSTRIDDRFQLTIGLVNMLNGVRILLSSCEGSPEDSIPPSPPLQQMYQQEINGQQTLLGVGMAGQGHWSSSVTQRVDAQSVQWEFDQAVRTSNSLSWAGNTWQLPVDESIEVLCSGDHSTLVYPVHEVKLRFQISAESPQTAIQWMASDRRLVVGPSIPKDGTTTWRFTIEIRPLD